jgi:hypothetical protein
MTPRPDDRDLEQRLTTLLRNRALDIRTTPEYRTEPEPAQSGLRRVEPAWDFAPTRRRLLTTVVAAVLIFLALAATALIAVHNHDRSEPASPIVNGVIYGGRCQLNAPSSFTQVLDDATLGSGLGSATVIGGNSDGALLLAESDTAGVTSAVVTLSPTGEVVTVWRAAAGEQVHVVANPFGSFNTSGAAFETIPTDGGQPSVWQYDARNHLIRLDMNAGYTPQTSGALPEYLSDYYVELVEHSITQPNRQAIPFYPNASGGVPTPTGMQPVSNVVQLLVVGGNTILVEQPPGRPATISTPPTVDASVPTSAAIGGSGFVSDRTTLRWLRNDADRHDVLAWTPGSLRTVTTPVNWATGSDRLSLIGPYLARQTTHGQQLLDLRTGALLVLPAEATLLRVDGPEATFATDAHNQTALSRIPVIDIPAPRC